MTRALNAEAVRAAQSVVDDQVRIVDMERPGVSYRSRVEAAAARACSLDAIDTALRIGVLCLVRNSLQIIADAEAAWDRNAAAAQLPARLFRYWYRRGLIFADLEPAELAEVRTEILRRDSEKRGGPRQ